MNLNYKNLSLILFSLLIALFVARSESFHAFLLNLGGFGYLGAFIAGFLFVSTFTGAIATIILFTLAEKLSPLEMGLIAGAGAVAGDFIISRLIKDNILQELKPIYNHFRGRNFVKILHEKYFSWTLPVIGALIIASPLPDELGVGLLGLVKMKTYQFLILSFTLNTIGIFLVISVSLLFN